MVLYIFSVQNNAKALTAALFSFDMTNPQMLVSPAFAKIKVGTGIGTGTGAGSGIGIGNSNSMSMG